MYKLVNLSNKNLDKFKKLNNARKEFNFFNKDFFEDYYSCNFIQKYFMKKNVKLLAHSNKVIGYVWYDQGITGDHSIESMYVVNNPEYIDGYKELISHVEGFRTSRLVYLCEQTEFTGSILKDAEFLGKDGAYLMSLSLKNYFHKENGKDDLSFYQLVVEKDESMRLEMQNEVFKSPTRIPLTLDDVFFDEDQDYYYDKGAIFLKKLDKYVGYGQIIFENQWPFIVNLGILPEFRGNGYSRILLNHLLGIIKNQKHDKVYLKVDISNKNAVNLYKSTGFIIEKEFFNFEKRR